MEGTRDERVTRGLRMVQQALQAILHDALAKQLGGRWWTDGVLAALTEAQRRELPAAAGSAPPQDWAARLDLAALVRVVDGNWQAFARKGLRSDDRTWLLELGSLRRRWADQSAGEMPADEAWRALSTMARLLAHIAPGSAENAVRALADEVRDGGAAVAAARASMAPTIALTQAPARAPERGVRSPGQPRPWREVATPHADVSSGRYLEAEFAADLAQVLAGQAGSEYGDPVEFFARTYLTDGMRRLLVAALRRTSGRGGEPVVQVRTAFGGGKTHAMLALYHVLRGRAAAAQMAGVAGVLTAAGIPDLPAARVAVLAGTDLSPAKPWASRAVGGRPVRTLWGELAAQLGGEAAYARVAAEDERGVGPGAGALVELLDAHGPCVVLIDELVAFLRVLYERSEPLPAGSFDANLTFVQNLTEAVRRSRASMVVATIPESASEKGGRGGQEAAARVEATFGRLEAIWRPVQPQEGFEVVRRRLFLPLEDVEGRDAACRAFARMYADQAADFPAECRSAEYLGRLRASYPIHPEVFDRLGEDWSTLGRFQRTRGVLRLMAAAVYELWRRGDAAPMILPGSLPLDAPKVRDHLTACLDEGWNTVVDRDVDGEGAEPAAVERENQRFGREQVARRLARTIFLGSAPSAREQSVRGIDAVRIRLGTVLPGESLATFNDALGRLRERLTYLYSDGSRFWYDTRPNLRRTAADRAAGLDEYEVLAHLLQRVQGWVKRRDRVATRALHGMHAVDGAGEIADDAVARLAILPLSAPYHPGTNGTSKALTLAQKLLDARTRHTNMLVALAADEREVVGVVGAAREFLAWRSIAADVESGRIHLDTHQRREVGEGLRRAEQTVEGRLAQAYRWLLVPVQEGTAPLRWEPVRLVGDDDPLPRAVRKLEGDQLLKTRCSPAELRLELDRWLWTEAPDIGVAELWGHLTKYLYLPRFSDQDVLVRAIAEGVATGELFAYAEAKTADGRYLGLRLGVPGVEVRVDAASRLVKPDVARAQIEADARPADAPTAVRDAPTAAAAAAAASMEAQPLEARETPTEPAPPTRFFGTAPLDPLRAARDAGRIAEEVLQHLAALPGATARLTLEIEVRVPGGVPEDVARVVRENARALRFNGAEFER